MRWRVRTCKSAKCPSAQHLLQMLCGWSPSSTVKPVQTLCSTSVLRDMDTRSQQFDVDAVRSGEMTSAYR